jgi:hypothetical protein
MCTDTLARVKRIGSGGTNLSSLSSTGKLFVKVQRMLENIPAGIYASEKIEK